MELAGLIHLSRPALAKNTNRTNLQDSICSKRNGSHRRNVEIAPRPIKCG
jgi:hypothetical protein